jgi:hypothetical protein
VSYCSPFSGFGVNYKAHDTLCLRGITKKSSFLCFGVPGRFTTSMTLNTCLRGMIEKSSSLYFRVVFVSYCP